MKKHYIFLSFLLIGRLFASNDLGTVSIDGLYAPVPNAASEPDLATQALSRLLLSPNKLERAKISGKVEAIKIAKEGVGLRITVVDSSMREVLSDIVQVSVREAAGESYYTFETKWKTGDEWGSSSGVTTTTLKKEYNGCLFIKLTTVSRGRFFILPTGEEIIEQWLRYPPLQKK